MIDYILLGFSTFMGVIVGEFTKDIYRLLKSHFTKNIGVNGGDKENGE